MKGQMKITSGFKLEDGVRVFEPRYCRRCSASLTKLLEDKKEVEISALGSSAIANVMKTISYVSKDFEKKDVELRLDAPVYKRVESEDGTEVVVFTITVYIV